MFRLIILSLMLLVVTYFNRSGKEGAALSEPSLIRLNMKLNQPGENTGATDYSSHQLHVKSSSLSLSKIEFDGVQANGKDFHFATPLQYTYTTYPGDTGSSTPALPEFDVPKGQYQSAGLILHANGRDSLPAMTIHALWTQGSRRNTIPLEIRFFDFPEVLRLRLEPEQPGEMIYFPENGVNRLMIQIDPGLIIETLDPRKLSEAEILTTPNGRKLIISRHQNAALHAEMAVKVNESIRAFVQDDAGH